MKLPELYDSEAAARPSGKSRTGKFAGYCKACRLMLAVFDRGVCPRCGKDQRS